MRIITGTLTDDTLFIILLHIPVENYLKQLNVCRAEVKVVNFSPFLSIPIHIKNRISWNLEMILYFTTVIR
jgi:hypothetical protein